MASGYQQLGKDGYTEEKHPKHDATEENPPAYDACQHALPRSLCRARRYPQRLPTYDDPHYGTDIQQKYQFHCMEELLHSG